MLLFNGIGFVILFLILLFQDSLPLNPQKFGAFNLSFAINTASSFITNTNWQVYSGETAASYFTQMAGLTVHNFLSAATGICIAIAVMRGITRQSTYKIGNFWVDMTRCTLYILLPISFIFALVLVSQGVIQNIDPLCKRHRVWPYRTSNNLNGTSSFPGSDKRVRYQRRRIFQCKLCTSI
jgi:K+-transporting ATPase ATPase A chain